MALAISVYVAIEMNYEGYHGIRYGRERAHAEEVLEGDGEGAEAAGEASEATGG